MKQIVPFLWIPVGLLFIFSSGVFGQTTIKYSYDNAGNRTARHIIVLTTKADSSTRSDKDVKKDETFEDKLGNRKITIYPNPTQGQLQVVIQGADTNTGLSLRLFNLSGNLLIDKTPATPSTTLDLSGYPIGTYVLKIIVGTSVSEWKIVKQ